MAESETAFIRKTLLVTGILFATLLLLAAVFAAAGVWLMAFAGILFGVMLQGLAAKLGATTHLPYGAALAIVCVAIPSLLVLFFIFAGPGIAAQINQLRQQIPQALQALYEHVETIAGGDSLQSLLPEPQQILQAAAQSIGRLAGLFSTTLGALLSALVVLFVAIYLAISPALYIDAIIHLFPKGRRGRMQDLLGAMGHALRWWLVGRFASMALVGVLVAIGLLLLNIPLALTLGLFAALLCFVPNIGPVVSAVPAVLLGFIQSPMTALYVILLYVGIQSVESYLITPIIQKKVVSLPPALLILVQLFFGAIAGIPGLLLAAPIVVCLILLIQTLYIQDALDDEVERLGDNHR